MECFWEGLEKTALPFPHAGSHADTLGSTFTTVLQTEVHIHAECRQRRDRGRHAALILNKWHLAHLPVTCHYTGFRQPWVEFQKEICSSIKTLNVSANLFMDKMQWAKKENCIFKQGLPWNRIISMPFGNNT